jgi:uncharacterized delta-60 repeat protein
MTKSRQSPLSEVISKITRGIVPTTAIASGLLAPPALGAPGDLDPTFSDMGRISLPLKGAALRVQELITGESLIAGGEHLLQREGCDYYHYFCYADDGFIGQVSPTGRLDLQVGTDLLAGTQVLDFALQPDGKAVAVGEMISNYQSVLTVFRLAAGGSLDPSFADAGVMHYATDTSAQSVVLDPSGAIVVAGSNAGKLMVLRLLANGVLDGSFGKGGVYTGPANDGTRIHIVRTGSGGYRVSATLSDRPHAGVSSCGVVALTAAGILDTTFGTAGIASLAPKQPGDSTGCQAMTAQTNGGLLLGGQEAGHGFVNRLLASGAIDPSLAAGAVQSNMAEATALTVDSAGSILVAGVPNPGVPGALILRLQATGVLDDLFGNHGLTWVDLPSSSATAPALDDLSVLSDGRILAAGADSPTDGGQQPLLVRLVGTSGTSGPGIIGLTPLLLSVKEADQTALVTVRRTGGAAGAVSVSYQTSGYTGADAAAAISGTDYTPVTGRLTWADGDRSDRQIAVPIRTDSGKVEEAERFNVMLTGAQGGAEIGTQDAIVEIAADGDPIGQFGFADSSIAVSESDGNAQVVVNRNYYSKGAVSVTVVPVAGSATTAEFSAAPITLSWADGDSSPQTAMIPIVNEKVAKSPESFTVKLSNATNGALIGPHSQLLVTINYDYQPPPAPAAQTPSGGGGALDWFALLCLGCFRWLRRCAVPVTSREKRG